MPNNDEWLAGQRARLLEKLTVYKDPKFRHSRIPEAVELKMKVIQYIERALEKITQGTYGVCEDCEEEIPRARHNLLPGAIRCCSCQADHDATL